MSGYGPPPSAPPGRPSPEHRPSAANPHLIGYAAGALGVLSFVWGFLTWYSQSGQTYAGYSIAGGPAGAAIGLSLVAGLLAAAAAWLGRDSGAAPAVLAVAAFLVTLGTLIAKSPSGSDFSTGAGLILELITTIVQAAGLSYLLLQATGRLPQPRPRQSTGSWPGGASQYGQVAPPPGQFPPAPPPGGYTPAGRTSQGYQHPGQPPYAQPPGAVPPPAGGQQPGPPPFGGGTSPYAPPPAPPSPPAQSAPSSPQGASPDSTLQFGGRPQDPATEQWSPQQSYPPPENGPHEADRPGDGERS